MRDFRQQDWAGAGTRHVEKISHGCNAGEERARADSGLFLPRCMQHRSAIVDVEDSKSMSSSLNRADQAGDLAIRAIVLEVDASKCLWQAEQERIQAQEEVLISDVCELQIA